MKKETLKSLLLVIALCSISLAFTSCSSTEDTAENAVIHEYNYYFPNETAETTISLTDLVDCKVTQLIGQPSWAEISAADSVTEHPSLIVKTTQTGPNENASGDATLMMSDGSTVILHLSMGYNGADGSNGAIDTMFANHWEKVDTMRVNFGKYTYPITLPWGMNHMDAFDEDIASDIQKSNGWEMAFSTLGQTARGGRGFGLYNKYTGILRVFMYVDDATGMNSEYFAEVIMGGTTSGRNKRVFFNGMPYSIPANKKYVAANCDIIGSGCSRTFRNIITPWLKSDYAELTSGWIAFDVDMSCYSSSATTSIFDTDERLDITIRTQTNTKYHLTGTLSANILGSFKDQQVNTTTSTLGGIASLLSNAGSALGNTANSSLRAIESALTGNVMNNYLGYAGTICNVASYVLKAIDGGSTKYDTIPGKIEMNLAGKLGIGGYTTSATSNNDLMINLKFSEMKNSVYMKDNPYHLGEGVWGLSEPPVIYIVKDHFMSQLPLLTAVVSGEHSYKVNDAASNELRLISFLDPTTVKIGINPHIFNDSLNGVENVEVNTYCIIYPNVGVGNTTVLRNAAEMDIPTSVDILDYAKHPKGTFYRSSDTNKGYKMTFHQLEKEQFVNSSLDESPSLCTTMRTLLPIGNDTSKYYIYRFYGQPYTDGASEDNSHVFMIDPQVYFPVLYNDKEFYDFTRNTTPDFLVVVNLRIKTKDDVFFYSRRFIPDIKLIDSSQLESMKSRLKNYADDTSNKKVINRTDGTNSPVRHPYGYKYVQRALKELDAITK